MPKIVQFNQHGNPDVLQVVEVPAQTPGAKEVRITVKAFGVQRADTLWREGQYIQAPARFPTGLGYDCVGIVDAVGEEVTKFSTGEKVMVLPGFSLNEYSVYGDSAVVAHDYVYPLPDVDLSWEEYAVIPVPYYTSYFPLLEIANLSQAKVILVTAAACSVGIAAMQMAKAEGVTVIGTSRTSAKKDQILKLGADYFIATEEEDIVTKIREIVGTRGVDIVFDPIGGKMISQWYQVIKRSGYIIHYGVLDSNDATVSMMPAIFNAVTLKSYVIFEFTGNKALELEPNQAAVTRATQYINNGFETGKFKPVIAKSFSLQDVADSHRFLESNQQIGKIVVKAG